MRHIMYMLVMVVLVQSAHHLRQSKQTILKGQNIILAEREVQYINDDVDLGSQVEQQEKTFSEINVHEQQTEQQVEEEPAVLQVDEEQTLTQEQMDELDRKEQEEYERLKKQRLQEQHINDDDSYLQSVEEQGQTLIVEQGGEMPVDVVEHQLTPTIPKDPIPDQKGTVSPFAPADNSLPYSTYDSETGFEVKEADIKMDGSIGAKELDAYLEEQYRKEQEYFANVKI